VATMLGVSNGVVGGGWRWACQEPGCPAVGRARYAYEQSAENGLKIHKKRKHNKKDGNQ
jgi:hypothetical protein